MISFFTLYYIYPSVFTFWPYIIFCNPCMCGGFFVMNTQILQHNHYVRNSNKIYKRTNQLIDFQTPIFTKFLSLFLLHSQFFLFHHTGLNCVVINHILKYMYNSHPIASLNAYCVKMKLKFFIFCCREDEFSAGRAWLVLLNVLQLRYPMTVPFSPCLSFDNVVMLWDKKLQESRLLGDLRIYLR